MLADRSQILSRFPNLSEKMTVYSANGERLGKVDKLESDCFVVEKGIFFPKDFMFRYDDIQDIRDNEVYLKMEASDLGDWRNESYAGWEQTDAINTGSLNATPRAEYQDQYPSWSDQQVNVPLMEEELEAQKTSRQAGEVKIHKIVHTELRHFNIPVTREEIRIERVPVNQTGEVSGTTSDAFQEKTITVPLMEEEVSVSKRPVVREEVRISKDQTTEQRSVEGEVRKEEVQIEDEGKTKRKRVA